jgi:hypothetical protein
MSTVISAEVERLRRLAEKYPLQPEAPCRERSNESNMRGQCMRCGAELGGKCKENKK